MRSARTAQRQLRELVGFMLVGGGAALGYFMLACTLKYLGMGATMASALSYGGFIPISYWGHRKLTFNSTGRAAVEVPKFVVVSSLGVAIGSLVPYVVTDVLSFPAWIGFAWVCGIVPVVSYAGFRLWVFRQRRYCAGNVRHESAAEGEESCLP